MQARFTPAAIWNHLRSTYWFLPSVITVGALGLAVGLATVDRRMDGTDVLPDWFFGGGADGARALLSAVAGSIITVVSVTFSVTIVALTVSSQHFGPRLLNNFMRDTSAQVVLGIFIATFAYCLVVLRAVQGDGDDYDRFVPHMAVTGAVVLALVSVAALIYYVHHVSLSMQVSEIALAVSRDLERAIDHLYPAHLGEDAGSSDVAPAPSAGALPLLLRSSGYVQHIEADRVLASAGKADVVIWLLVRPGDFATEGLPFAMVEPAPADIDGLESHLNEALILGPDRSSMQDAGFPVQQLVEVTLHALSSGINEPFTALTCIDRLGQGLARLATRRMPSALRSDAAGRVRVVAPRDTFADLLARAFDPIRASAADSPEVGQRLLDVLARLARLARRRDDCVAIGRQADLVRSTMERWRQDEAYHHRIEEVYRDVQATVSGTLARTAR